MRPWSGMLSPQSLHHDGDLYRRIIENTSDLVFVVSADGICQYANAAARGSLELAEGSDVFAAIHHDDVATARETFARVAAGSEQSLNYRVRDPRASWRWLEIWASSITHRTGRCAVAIARDITERKRADQRQALQLAVSRVLAETLEVGPAAAQLLEAICGTVGFEVGELWQHDETTHELSCLEQWQCPTLGARELATATFATRFPTGTGLPGSVWKCSEPMWISDVGNDPIFMRAEVARRAGLHTAVGCPIVHRGQLLAVLVLLSRDRVEPNREHLDLLAAVGSQIAQYLARQRVETALREANNQLRAVVDFAPIILFAIDGQGIVTFAKGRGLAMAGMAPNGHLGESVRAVYADNPELLAKLERALRGDAFIEQAELNGRTFETVWTPAYDGENRPNGTIGVSLDVTDRARAERAIEEYYRTSLHEKERSLKEVHHRVKNNLQLVVSLIALQAGQLEAAYPGVSEAFLETQLRIQTMALIHETLCKTSNVSHLELATHIESICAQVYQSFGVDPSCVGLEFEIAEVTLGLDVAVPCGLIINELVTNALEHAFPDGRRGIVSVRLTASEDRIQLSVSDDGVGLPPAFDVRTCDSLGLQLVHDLAEQLEATLEIRRERGTTVVLGVPTRRLDGVR